MSFLQNVNLNGKKILWHIYFCVVCKKLKLLFLGPFSCLFNSDQSTAGKEFVKMLMKPHYILGLSLFYAWAMESCRKLRWAPCRYHGCYTGSFNLKTPFSEQFLKPPRWSLFINTQVFTWKCGPAGSVSPSSPRCEDGACTEFKVVPKANQSPS